MLSQSQFNTFRIVWSSENDNYSILLYFDVCYVNMIVLFYDLSYPITIVYLSYQEEAGLWSKK